MIEALLLPVGQNFKAISTLEPLQLRLRCCTQRPRSISMFLTPPQPRQSDAILTLLPAQKMNCTGSKSEGTSWDCCRRPPPWCDSISLPGTYEERKGRICASSTSKEWCRLSNHLLLPTPLPRASSQLCIQCQARRLRMATKSLVSISRMNATGTSGSISLETSAHPPKRVRCETRNRCSCIALYLAKLCRL